ncbi:hypothetical protein BTJ_4027 [Burkholderia thailandensis E444]|nr:hypothetical protein BTJ_4027 [Burkholderia thailandensis E444]
MRGEGGRVARHRPRADGQHRQLEGAFARAEREQPLDKTEAVEAGAARERRMRMRRRGRQPHQVVDMRIEFSDVVDQARRRRERRRERGALGRRAAQYGRRAGALRRRCRARCVRRARQPLRREQMVARRRDARRFARRAAASGREREAAQRRARHAARGHEIDVERAAAGLARRLANPCMGAVRERSREFDAGERRGQQAAFQTPCVRELKARDRLECAVEQRDDACVARRARERRWIEFGERFVAAYRDRAQRAKGRAVADADRGERVIARIGRDRLRAARADRIDVERGRVRRRARDSRRVSAAERRIDGRGDGDRESRGVADFAAMRVAAAVFVGVAAFFTRERDVQIGRRADRDRRKPFDVAQRDLRRGVRIGGIR